MGSDINTDNQAAFGRLFHFLLPPDTHLTVPFCHGLKLKSITPLQHIRKRRPIPNDRRHRPAGRSRPTNSTAQVGAFSARVTIVFS